MTGPRSRDRRGRRRRRTLAVSRSREEAEETMSERNLHFSTTERAIKGAERAGPSSSPAGKGSSGRRRVGDGGREPRRGSGSAAGDPGAPNREEDLEGVWEREVGIPTEAAPPGPRVFSVAPRCVASRYGGDFLAYQPKRPWIPSF